MYNQMPYMMSVLTFVAVLSYPIVGAADGPRSWTGEWQVMWRDGTVLISLEQSGVAVTGSVKPHGGRLSGTVEGSKLKGEWTRDSALIPVEFVMAEDGQTFTGRYGRTEYFNGERLSVGQREDPTRGLVAARGQPVQRELP